MPPEFEPQLHVLTPGPNVIERPPQRAVPAPTAADGLFGFDGRDERSRPFNLLRGQLTRLAAERQIKVIGITSATPRVGKSFVASNLAAALSRVPDLRTYLFDLDLRRASVAANFAIPVEQGLSEFLDGTTDDLAALSWGVEEQRLTIFPAVARMVPSSELLASSRMDILVAAMRQTAAASLSICDLPPVFANDDAVIFSQKADGFILVVEEGITTKRQVQEALRMLAPATFLGTVLNRYRGGLGETDYGYGYGSGKYYSGYYEQ